MLAVTFCVPRPEELSITHFGLRAAVASELYDGSHLLESPKNLITLRKKLEEKHFPFHTQRSNVLTGSRVFEMFINS